MKTTVTITVEEVDNGHRIKINHDGDRLKMSEIAVVGAALSEYWRAIEIQENAVESLRIMKAKRKDMKKFINDSVDWLEKCQHEGMLKDSNSGDSIPF